MSKHNPRTSMQMPASVLSYFTEPETRMATDLLLAKKRPSVPEDVRWHELKAFYRACLAAKQVEAEHAVFLCEVWDEVCKPMSPPWTFSAPHEQKEDCSTDIAKVWQHFCHTREFFLGEYGCEIVISVTKEEGLQIGYGLWFKSKTLLRKGGPDGWDQSDEYWWSPEEAIPIANDIDLNALRQFAADGKKLVASLVRNHVRQGN